MQVFVEHHGHAAHKEPAHVGNLHALRVHAEQAVGLHGVQALQLGGEVGGKVDLVGLADGVKAQPALAHQGHDDGAAQQIVLRGGEAAHHGQAALLQRLAVFVQGFGILAVDVADVADGGDAQADQVAVGLGAVALEVAVQAALAFGDGQRIARQGKVVHAHVVVAGGIKGGQCAREHGNFACGAGQFDDVDAALGLEALGQVGVGVQGDAVGAQFGHLGQGAVERGGGLPRQSVDQVDVDGVKADAARGLYQGKYLLGGLDAVYGLLHVGVEVLHAQADAVEAQIAQGLQARGADGARVHFDGVFAIWRKAEAAPQQGHEGAQLVVAEEGGGAAAQVQLAEGLARAQVAQLQRQLLRQQGQVGGGAVVVLGDDLVAAAVVAQRFAKRDMHVHRQGLGGGRATAALLKRVQVVGLAKAVGKAVGRGIGGVARARHVKAREQLGGDGGDQKSVLRGGFFGPLQPRRACGHAGMRAGCLM